MFKSVVPAYVSPAYEREKNPHPEDGHHTKIPHLKEKINNLDFSFRTIVADSGDSGDSLIVLISNKTDPRVLAQLIKDHALPVKNIPDAIRWHYAGFWQHLLGKKARKKNS